MLLNAIISQLPKAGIQFPTGFSWDINLSILTEDAFLQKLRIKWILILIQSWNSLYSQKEYPIFNKYYNQLSGAVLFPSLRIVDKIDHSNKIDITATTATTGTLRKDDQVQEQSVGLAATSISFNVSHTNIKLGGFHFKGRNNKIILYHDDCH